MQEIFDKYNTSLRTKEVVEAPFVYDKMPIVDHIPEEYKMNYDKILDKPFLISTIPWSNSATVYTELTRLAFPAALQTNALANVPFDSAMFFQAQMCCMLQVSGTPMHQGLLCVAAVPHGAPAVVNPNQILAAPHVFINANESTSVCLECPFYSSTNVVRTKAAGASDCLSPYGFDVFDLVLFVMDPLQQSAGASTTVSLSIHCIFKKADFYVPKVPYTNFQAQCGLERGCWPCGCKSDAHTASKCKCGNEISSDFRSEGFVDRLMKIPTQVADGVATGLKKVSGDLIDALRVGFRELTGFHNPNIPTIEARNIVSFQSSPNSVDTPTHMAVMDNHSLFSRVYDDFYFRTSQDEMDLKYLLSKPVFLGKFKVDSNTVVGKNLMAYPISPYVEVGFNGSAQAGDASNPFYSVMRTVYEMSRHWRGDLKLHIQAVCTNFHYCKIAILKDYQMSSLTGANRVPRYVDIHNLNIDTLEFSAGGQIQTIDLKYASFLKQIECTKDLIANSSLHGMVYAYLMQPLTYNSNVPLSVTFNVYMSGGDNLEFSGYSTDNFIVNSGADPVYPAIPNLFGKQESGIYAAGKYNDASGAYEAKLEEDRLKYLMSDNRSVYVVPKGTSVSPELLDRVSYMSGVSVKELEKLNPKFKESVGTKNGYTVIVEAMTAKPQGAEEGNATTVQASSQEDVNNQQVNRREVNNAAFRPNTSIRDYLRFMYPKPTLTETPTVQQTAHVYLLSDFFKCNGSLDDGFKALASSFLGHSGGLKVKFKITGASTAALVYVPPGVYAPGSNFQRFYSSRVVPDDVAVGAEWIKSIHYNPETKSFTAPQIEIPDYVRPCSTSATGSTAPAMSNTLELECVIPNMNMCNFVGDATKWRNTSSPLSDFGAVILYYNAVSNGSSYVPVNIVPFVGLSDEARLGFQCFNVAKKVPLVASTTIPAAECRVSLFNSTPIGGVIPGAYPMKWAASRFGKDYYFNL